MSFDFENVLKNAKDLKENFDKAQSEFVKKEFTAQSGGGLVSVTLNGKGKAVKVHIDEGLVEKKDIVTIQDLIVAAINSAKDIIDNESKDVMKDFMPNFNMSNMPDLSDLFKK